MESKNKICDPNDVAVKSFFLGPSAENQEWLKAQILGVLGGWTEWRKAVNGNDGPAISADDARLAEFIKQQTLTSNVISDIAKQFENEIPKFSPRYIGHMFSEISMPALLGHIITLLHNPNNISAEASKVGTEIEKLAIRELCKMSGYQDGIGHFTSGGTVANFEFLIRARERLSKWLAVAIAAGEKDVFRASLMGWDQYKNLAENISDDEKNKYLLYDNVSLNNRNIRDRLGFDLPPPVLLVSDSKHYSWPKAMHYFGLGECNIRYIKLDDKGRLSVSDLLEQIRVCEECNIPVLGIVAVAGTTELGTVDPIQHIADRLGSLRVVKGLHLWLHIDAAYGGFFRSMIVEGKDSPLEKDVYESLKYMDMADSITLDPHKLGYVPYASGTFLCKKPDDYFMKSFTGPYIVSDQLNVGNFTLEGSRSAAGAVATYASMKSFSGSSGYSRILGRTISAKKIFRKALENSGARMIFPEGLDTNILCFAALGSEDKLSSVNRLNLKLYERIQSAGQYWVSKTTLQKKNFGSLLLNLCESARIEMDTDEIILLRLTLMNPFVLSKEGATDHPNHFVSMFLHELRGCYDEV